MKRQGSGTVQRASGLHRGLRACIAACTIVGVTATLTACGADYSTSTYGPGAGTHQLQRSEGERTVVPVMRAVDPHGEHDVIRGANDDAKRYLSRLADTDLVLHPITSDMVDVTENDPEHVILGITAPQYRTVSDSDDGDNTATLGAGVDTHHTGSQVVRIDVNTGEVTPIREMPIPDGYAPLLQNVLRTGVMDFTAQQALDGFSVAQTFGVNDVASHAQLAPSVRTVLGAVGTSAAMFDTARMKAEGDGASKLGMIPGGTPATGLCALETPDAVRLSKDHENMINEVQAAAAEQGAQVDRGLVRELRDTAGTGGFVSVDGQPSLVVRDVQGMKVSAITPITVPLGAGVDALDVDQTRRMLKDNEVTNKNTESDKNAESTSAVDDSWLQRPVGGVSQSLRPMGVLPGVHKLACLPVNASSSLADHLDIRAKTLGVGLVDTQMYSAAIVDALRGSELAPDVDIAAPRMSGVDVGKVFDADGNPVAGGASGASDFATIIDIDTGVVRAFVDLREILRQYDGVRVVAISADTVQGFNDMPALWCTVVTKSGETIMVRAGLEARS